MKQKALTFILGFAVLAMSNFITTPKAEAAIGLIMKNKTAKTIGGISAGGSAGVFVAGALLSKAGIVTFNLASAILFIYGTMFFGALGLVVLDDNTVADMNFIPIDPARVDQAKGLTLEEIQVYNSELEELNAIRKTIQAEMNEESKVSEATELWNAYKVYLSPETAKVAEIKAMEIAGKFEYTNK